MNFPVMFKLAGLTVALLGFAISVGLIPRVVKFQRERQVSEPWHLVFTLGLLYYAIMAMALTGPKIIWPLVAGYALAVVVGTIIMAQFFVFNIIRRHR